MKKDMAKFLIKASKDYELKDKIKMADKKEKLIELAAENGFTITEEDIQQIIRLYPLSQLKLDIEEKDMTIILSKEDIEGLSK